MLFHFRLFQANTGNSIKVELEIDPFEPIAPSAPLGSHFNQIREDKVKKTATVSLNDCLACSGCVTSAETVLITMQSTQELYRALQESINTTDPILQKIFVISLSPQSRTSLANHYNISPIVLVKKLTTFFQSIGIQHMVDTAVSLDIALIEARHEFINRWKNKHQKSATPTCTSPNPLPLPILASECPGWICYAEKTQGTAILPYISTVKPPLAPVSGDANNVVPSVLILK